MSIFCSTCPDLKDKKVVTKPDINTNDIKCNKNIIDKLENMIDMVFSNMKKRGSHTDLRIDYPWLTI